MKKIISTYCMNKSSLKKLSKSQLIQLLLQQNVELQPKNVKPQPRKPIPTPRKSVKQMVQDYEDNIILPPLEFRDDYKPIPKPRTKKPVPLPRTKKPVPLPRAKKPVPLPWTKIEQVDKALKGYTKSFEINIKNNKDPLAQLQSTRKATAYHLISELTYMKGLKFIETLRVTFTKITDSDIVYKAAYFNSIAQTIVNNLEVAESLQLSKQQILNTIAQ